MNTASLTGQQAPRGFIRAFRRRSLTVSFLYLSFLASLANEGVRWLAIWANMWLGTNLPVFSVGPFFLVVAFLYTLRRSSLEAAAEGADRALDLSDRLTSFLDIAGRGDVPAPIARAQREETAAALSRIPPSHARSISVLFWAGPLLLVLSVFYPNLMTLMPPTFQVARYSDDARRSPVGPEQFDSPGELSEEDPESHPATEDEMPETPPVEETASPDRDDGPSLAGPPLEVPGDRPAGEGPRPSTVTEEPSILESNRTGEELSRIVDPLFSPLQEDQPAVEEMPAGSMAFRLLPEAAAGGGQGGGGESAGELPARVQIDFDDIPGQYRILVKRYFDFLGEEKTDGADGAGEREGRRKE
jgi:hypothetical protein